MYPTCIVTMFFNLNSTTRPLEFYLQHGRPTLELDCPMVVFCDKDTRPLLQGIRGHRETLYVEKSIFDYEHVQTWLPIVRKNREVSGYPEQRVTPEYMMVTTFKPLALYLAKQMRPAKTYMWVDLGASHVARRLSECAPLIAAKPRPKIACCYVAYRTKNEIYPMSRFLASGGPCGMAATLLTVEADYVERFYTSMFSVLYEQISEGVGHNEEQALIYVYHRHPEWFSLYFGDYGSTATNYFETVEDGNSVETFIVRPAIANGDRAIADAAQTYGKPVLAQAVLWHPESVAARAMLDGFHHFIALAGGFHTGWGSYMFDGQRYAYQIETLKKQEALFRAGVSSTHVLEIGVYVGHSLLILLLSNPTLRITCVDNDARFAPRAVEYLNSQFGNRIDFHLGDAADVLPRLEARSYDCVHIDADHNIEAVRQQFALSKPLAAPRAYVVFDDYEAVQPLIDGWIARGELDLIEKPGCLWTNIVTQLRE